MHSATPRHPLKRVGRIAIAVWSAACSLLWTGIASGESVPGPPLESSASQPGAYCLPRADSAGLGGAGFAGAVAAIAFVARRRRDLA